MSTAPSNWAPKAPSTKVMTASTGFARRLDSQELRRRIWHMSPGLLPFLLWPIPHKDPISSVLWGIIVAIFALLTGAMFISWSRIARAHTGNSDRLAAIYGYAGAVLLLLFLFPAHPECGLAVLGVLAFGDGSATLFGKLIGGARLPWNPSKSIGGLFGFLAVGTPMTALIYWGESNNLEAIGPPATLAEAVVIALAGVLSGAIAESVPSRINDNVRVGFCSAVAIVASHALIFGL